MRKASLLCLLLIAFAKPAFAVKYEGRLVSGVWEDPWSETLKAELTASPLYAHYERQIERLCPGYRANTGKRELFWQQLMISLSWKESLHGPENYVHFKAGTNDGLFQINPVLRTYYDCAGYDLFNPLDNIKCAVKMATKLVKRYGSFLSGQKSGMAAYWQPLRSTSRLNRRNRAAILAEVTQACRTGALVYRCQPTAESLHLMHAGHDGAMDEVDLSFNGIEDLGIPADQLDAPADVRTDQRYKAPTFKTGSN